MRKHLDKVTLLKDIVFLKALLNLKGQLNETFNAKILDINKLAILQSG